MKVIYRILPWFFVALFASELIAVLAPKKDGEFHLREFGRLPVLANGRIQPLDSFAHNSLLQLRSTASVPLEVLYNPQLLSYVSGAKGDVAADSFNSTADASRGALNISLNLSAGATQPANAVLARVTMRGEKPGVSYLVYRVPAIKTESGEVLNAQVRAARVVVK